MPAKDKYHDTVIRALQKDGWIITKEQVSFPVGGRNLWVDLQAEKEKDERIILIEIKGFENIASPIAHLQQLLGQYVLYRVAVQVWKLNYPIYVAVPTPTYNSFFQEEIVKLAIQSIDMKLVVFDPNVEVITKWIP